MRDAGPEEVEALEGECGEAGGVSPDPGFRELAALVDVGEFAELDVEACCEIGFGKANEDSIAEAVGAGAIAGVKLSSKVGAHRNESVQGAPVAPGPGDNAGDEEEAGEGGAGEGRGFARRA